MPDYLSLAAAAATLPGKPHPATLWRWCRFGLCGITLKHAGVGKRIITTRAWLDEWIATVSALHADRWASKQPAKQRPPVKSHRAADEALSKRGV